MRTAALVGFAGIFIGLVGFISCLFLPKDGMP